MNKKQKNIIKDKFYRLWYLKYELKKIILKSVKLNKSNTPIQTNLINYKITNFSKRTAITRQLNLCLVRGRTKGTYKLFQLCRHAMTKLANEGALQNVKVKSW